MKWLIGLGLIAMIVQFQNCAPSHETLTSDSSSSDSTTKSVAAFESTLFPVLRTNCASCHGDFQNPKFAVESASSSHSVISSSSLVNLTSASQSELVTKIVGGHQNIATSVATQIQTQIESWNQQISSASLTAAVIEIEPRFQSVLSHTLIPKCVSCHYAGGTGKDLSSYSAVLASGYLVKGDSAKSPLYLSVEAARMPPKASGSSLSNSELLALRDWIDQGAQNN